MEYGNTMRRFSQTFAYFKKCIFMFVLLEIAHVNFLLNDVDGFIFVLVQSSNSEMRDKFRSTKLA